MNPEWFVKSACTALPEQILSVVLYGSAAAGDFVQGTSSYDLLVVINRLEIQELEALAETVRQWRNAEQPLPLLFTPGQLRASVDAFAIEFAEMQHSRKVMYGDDPIQGITVDPAHVRIHLERELKGKSLALRDRYAFVAGDRQRVIALLTESLSTFLSLFRATLRLYQSDAPSHKLEALSALSKHIPFDPEPLRTIAKLRVQGEKTGRHAKSLIGFSRKSASGSGAPDHTNDVDVRSLFSQYCHSIEVVTQAVDQRLQSES